MKQTSKSRFHFPCNPRLASAHTGSYLKAFSALIRTRRKMFWKNKKPEPRYSSARCVRVLSAARADIIFVLPGYEIRVGDCAWIGDPSPKPLPGWLSVSAIDREWLTVWWAFMPIEDLSDAERFDYLAPSSVQLPQPPPNPRPFRIDL